MKMVPKRKWECEICKCESDAIQEQCPNGCEKEEDMVEIVRRFHASVDKFFDYHVTDSYDHCMLTAKKEFTEMKKAFWEVKEKILDK